jgi:hypothetical protein
MRAPGCRGELPAVRADQRSGDDDASPESLDASTQRGGGIMVYPSTANEAHRLEPAVGTLAADADARPLRVPRRSGWTWLVWIALALAALGALVYYLWHQNQARQAAAPPPGATAQAAPPTAAAAPTINHPIEEAEAPVPPSVEQKPLPALMVSDATMQNTLAGLFGAEALGRMFYEDGIVHRFVATIDNLPRKTLPLRTVPVKPVAGTFATAGKDATLAIAPDNAARYTPYVRLVDAADAKTLVGIYVHFYPLLQQDYRALGYPNGYFNDRLVQAIDDLLAAPEVSSPVLLAQPKVLYQYVDADLESRSAGQKVMMRMGGENAAKLKSKLQEIRALLTQGNALPRK